MPPDPRAYWIEQMEAADGFMRKVLACPVAECGEPLACLRAAAGEAGVEIAFASGKHLGVFDRMFHVRQSLIEGLLTVAEAFLSRGLVLRVEDGYRRPQLQAMGAGSSYVVRTVIEKVMWELDGEVPSPELVFRRLAVWSATTPIFANHTSGSAVDVSALHREDGSPIDLGAPYPELSHRTPMTSPFVSRQARRNREMVCALFAARQFVPYPYEFWHFSHGDADYETVLGSGGAARFGPVHLDADSGKATAVKEIRKPFVTIEDILPYLDGQGRD